MNLPNPFPHVLGGFTQFRYRTGQIAKMGYWLHTRLSHYSETFYLGIHTMCFVKREIAKSSVGCIQGMSLCLRNHFLFFCNEHAQSTTLGPKLMFRVVSASKTVCYFLATILIYATARVHR